VSQKKQAKLFLL